ncbi:MAG: hypothetical protein ACPGOV_04435 [Magnetovibrionaceae bacterium]
MLKKSLSLLIASLMMLVLLLPFIALLAGLISLALVLVAGFAFLPVFAPITTGLCLAVFGWMWVREGQRRRRRPK